MKKLPFICTPLCATGYVKKGNNCVNGLKSYTPMPITSTVKCPPGYDQKQSFVDYEEGFAPEWTNGVPNWAICNWFYAFFIVNVSIFVIAVIFSFYTLKATKNINVKNPITLSVLLTLAISGTNTLFFYLICDRALDP